MIVNMNYVKKQWPDFPTVEMAYFRFINSSSLKTLFTLTILQCWCQFFCILLLSNNWLFRWHLGMDGKSKSYCLQSFKCSDFYTYLSQMFQTCDVTLSFWASYHFRISLFTYNNIQMTKAWIISNDAYLILSIFLIFSSIADGTKLSTKAIIMCLVAVYKLCILYKMHKEEKSSYIILEQRRVTTSNDSASKSSDEKHSLLTQHHVVDMGTE